MADRFKLRQEVHVVHNHCALCSQLELQMQHPITVRAILAYGEGSTYASKTGACLNINEASLCNSCSGHQLSLCILRAGDKHSSVRALAGSRAKSYLTK